MLFFIQSIIYLIVFTVLFIGIRQIPGMSLNSLTSTSEGAGWLYSEIGLIFGVFAAFTIQSQAKKWDDLLSSIRQEIINLRRLFWLSYHLPHDIAKKLQFSIQEYLGLITNEGWENIDTGNRSESLENSTRFLQEVVFDLPKNAPEYSSTATVIVRSIFESREERIFQSSKRTPLLLKATIYTGAGLMIVLSYFIGVSNFWIDYLFTGSIFFLTILIVMVIEDLEHPYRPGHWHITQDAYRKLLKEVAANNFGKE